jgi:hypothetical protein
VNSVQFGGGKSLDEQGTCSGHIAPEENEPPQTHWLKFDPSQRAYDVPVHPGQVSMAMK